MVTKQDLNELRRIATNTYDDDKKFINNLIVKIGAMEKEIMRLKKEAEASKSE